MVVGLDFAAWCVFPAVKICQRRLIEEIATFLHGFDQVLKILLVGKGFGIDEGMRMGIGGRQLNFPGLEGSEFSKWAYLIVDMIIKL